MNNNDCGNVYGNTDCNDKNKGGNYNIDESNDNNDNDDIADNPSS